VRNFKKCKILLLFLAKKFFFVFYIECVERKDKYNMKVNFNTYSVNYSAPKSCSPSFGEIQLMNGDHGPGAQDTLELLLSEEEYNAFKETVERSKSNKDVKLSIFGDGKNLSATCSDASGQIPESEWRIKSYEQRPYESPMHFLNRVVKKMNNRTDEVKGIIEYYASREGTGINESL
jgi:hypothetical protein